MDQGNQLNSVFFLLGLSLLEMTCLIYDLKLFPHEMTR